MITLKCDSYTEQAALLGALSAAGIEASASITLPPDTRLDTLARVLNGCGRRLSGRVVRAMATTTEPTIHPTVARIRAARAGGGM